MPRRRERRSPGAEQYRKLYGTPQWRALRAAVLTRDRYTCQRCGVIAVGAKNSPMAPTVNHINPHKGDALLFFDPANCQTVCKSCHDGAIQSEERIGYSLDCGADGQPTDPRHPWNTEA